MSTNDRKLKQGRVIDPKCLFSNQEDESRNRLFVSYTVTKIVGSKCWLFVASLEELRTGMQSFNKPRNSCRRNAFLSVALRLAWTTYTYLVWTERNTRVHKQQMQITPLSRLFRSLKATVSIRISISDLAAKLLSKDRYKDLCGH